MKSTILNLNKRVLVVEMPRLYGYNCYGDKMVIHNEFNKPVHSIDGKWDLICGGSELSEEILIPFLDYFVHEDDTIIENKTFSANVYKDYRDNGYLDNAIDSFISAIEASNYYWSKNHLGEEPRSYSEIVDGVSPDELMDDLREWQEAESRTLNPSQTLIFEIL